VAQLIRVFAVDETNSLDFEGMLHSHPGIEVLGTATSAAQASHKLSIVVPELVLYHPSNTGDEFKHLEKLNELCPQAGIMVLASYTDSDYVRKCLRAGADDYILLPIDGSGLQAEIEKTYRRIQKRSKHETLSVLMENFTGAPKILTFFSNKAGVGKTTLAVNTAVALAKFGKQVVLVDMALQTGDVSTFLKLTPQRTMADLIDIPIDNVADNVMSTLGRHESGLAVLAAPDSLTVSERVSVALVRVILQSLQRNFEYVIVDLASTVNVFFLTVFEMATGSFMVSTPNLAVLKTNRNLLDLMTDLEYDLTKVTHLLNSSNVMNGVKMQDVEKMLRAPVKYFFDYDFGLVEQTVNHGTPLVLWRERAKLAQSIYELADMLAGRRKSKRDGKS